jgi:hypothetical protein
MKMTGRDLKQLTPKEFQGPRAGYDILQVGDEEDLNRTSYCKCLPKKTNWMMPCRDCGRRIRI